LYDSEKERYGYIKDIYQTILLRDLVQKYGLRNKQEMLRIAEFMMDNISNLLAPNNIWKSLNADGSEITRKTISKYINYLENAFIFYEAKRYDLKGKKYLSSNSKYYISDPGLRYAVLGTRNLDYGRMYENIVYLELIRRGYEVYIGKLYKKEIDFVATRQSEKVYIQVADDISSKKTLTRELYPLESIRDSYPKILIARTKHETYDFEGIKINDLARWLSSENSK
jgi:hypothetical protein